MSTSRLGTVVRVRRLQERIARGGVASSRRAAVEREHELDLVRERVAVAAADVPAAGPAFVAHRSMLAGGAREIAVAGSNVAAAHDDVETAMSAWHDAARRLEGVERLDQRLTATAEAMREQRAAADRDDLTVLRWRRATTGRRTDDAT